jgi:hypothetical protein
MKMYVHYNNAGTITSMITFDGPDAGGTILVPKPGNMMTEIEDLEIKSKKPHLEELREVAKNYKVSVSPAKLIKK